MGKNPEPEPRNKRCRCHSTQIIPARPAQPRFDRPHSLAPGASKYALPTAACEVDSDVLPPLHPSSLHINSSRTFQTRLRRSPAKRKTILSIRRTQYHRIAHSVRSYCSLMPFRPQALLDTDVKFTDADKISRPKLVDGRVSGYIGRDVALPLARMV